jgi:hypothetical protein
MTRIRSREHRCSASNLGLLLLVLAAMSGCAPYDTAGGGSFSSPDVPRISGLQVRALTSTVSGRTIRWRITARITDPNGDVIGGTAEVGVHHVNDNWVHVDFPELRMTIVESDLAGERYSAILVVDNAPAGEIGMTFGVRDAAGNVSFGSTTSFHLRISGRTAPGSATRPEELQAALIHG